MQAPLADGSHFAASPEVRLEFFNKRSPWQLDNNLGEYPAGCQLSFDGLPLKYATAIKL